MIQSLKSFLLPAVVIAAIALIAPRLKGTLDHLGEASTESELLVVFLSIAAVCLLSFVSFYLSHGKPLPSFVMAIFLGMAARPLLLPIIENHIALSVIVSLGATLILFQGGLETSFKEFGKLFHKIALLAFPGVLISAVLFAYTVMFGNHLFNLAIPVTVAVLLGAVLASTDPAAIIPLFRGLTFKKNAIKDIVISESAVNDVVGALLTLALVGVAFASPFSSIAHGFQTLFGLESVRLLMTQLIFGVIAGVGGFLLLQYLSRHKKGHDFENGADAAFFICVPIIAFAAALEFGGSGYLAAFISGLIFYLSHHLKATEHFYSQVIDGFAKPAIFLLLGALVEIPMLLDYAAVGILVAFVFMLVVRPLMVFLMLGLFMFRKNDLTVRDLLFISFVRETGAIPAVLLVTVAALGLPDIEALVPVGMWVILLTLIIQPPLTPFVAKYLKVADSA